MIYAKVHNTPEGQIIAMCDSELLGKAYKQDKVELDLERYSDFYRGDEIDDKEAEKIVINHDFYTANVVGKKSVQIFINKGLASKADIRKINGIPFIQIFKMV